MTPCRGALILISLLTIAGCSSRDKSAPPVADGRIEIGYPVPAYATVSLEGDSVSLAALKGTVALVNIWATWCHPCRDEIPELIAIRERYKARGMELIGVSVDTDGTDDAIRTFMKDYRMTFPVWRDPDERISNLFLAIGVPATFLIDKEGILRWRKVGPIAPNDTSLTAAIERALSN